jgi:DNA topoisomerase-1
LKEDPYTVTLEHALECIRLKQEADANRIIQDFGVDNIQVLNGRYGPYISNKEKNARIPKGRDPKTLTLEESRALARGRAGATDARSRPLCEEEPRQGRPCSAANCGQPPTSHQAPTVPENRRPSAARQKIAGQATPVGESQRKD